jgi:hypothetical protein
VARGPKVYRLTILLDTPLDTLPPSSYHPEWLLLILYPVTSIPIPIPGTRVPA